MKAKCVECKKKFSFKPPTVCGKNCANTIKCRKWRETAAGRKYYGKKKGGE